MQHANLPTNPVTPPLSASQPPKSFTVRANGDAHAVELTVPGALLTITADTLSVMTHRRIQAIRWENLLEILDDLADYDDDTPVTLTEQAAAVADNRAALLAWLAGRAGVILVSRPANGSDLVDIGDPS